MLLHSQELFSLQCLWEKVSNRILVLKEVEEKENSFPVDLGAFLWLKLLMFS